jgi:hypothetical protein
LPFHAYQIEFVDLPVPSSNSGALHESRSVRDPCHFLCSQLVQVPGRLIGTPGVVTIRLSFLVYSDAPSRRRDFVVTTERHALRTPVGERLDALDAIMTPVGLCGVWQDGGFEGMGPDVLPPEVP